MDDWITVGRADEIPQGKSKLIQVKGIIISVFHTPDGWFAIEDRCPHRGGPLGEGKVEGISVTCPWHQARFNLKSGQCISSPSSPSVKTYPVLLKDGTLWVSKL